MTADESRQLQTLSHNVGELTSAVVDARVAVGRLEERVATLFHERDTSDRRCHDKHVTIERRLDALDTRERSLFGFQSRMAGAVALIALIGMVLGVLLSTGRILELY